MQVFAGADDGIGRAGRKAFCATDANFLVDDGHTKRLVAAARIIKRQRRPTQQLRQCSDALIAAWRASVDRGTFLGNRFRIRTATFVSALSALRLR